jgi:acyl-CoA dehydrogenase
MNAARTMTAGAIDAGESPAVLSAILKAYLTEGMRIVVNDAMDIQAGAGISRGPRNILARIYQGVPIGITVEGANIMTRSMIISGQGAIRSHPHVQDQIRAVETNDLARFDRAFFKHINSVYANSVRAWVGGVTNGRLALPRISGEMGRYFGQLSRMSAAFALVSDAAMLTVGGALKRREKLSGRLADCLAWLYLGSAVLKRFSDEGLPEVSRPYARWACDLALHRIQTALVGVLDHLPIRVVAWKLKWLIFPFGARFKPPGDDLGAAVARGLLDGHAARELLTHEVYIPPPNEPGLGQLERTLKLVVEARKVKYTIRDAVRAGRLKKAAADRLLADAVDAGVISAADREKVLEADEARRDLIQVDSFAAKGIHALQD